MKKTLFLLIFVLSIFTLAGCQEAREDVTDTTSPVISGTDDITIILGDEAPNWLENVTVTDDIDQNITITIDDSDLNLDLAGIYDLIYIATDEAGNETRVTVQVIIEDPDLSVFYVELINFEGERVLYETIPYDPDQPTLTLELIDAVIDLDYTVYDFGTMIHGINGNYPKEYGITYHYYYEIQVDGQPAASAIDYVVYYEGTVISFVETSYISELDLEVDAYIYDFINNQVDTYISNESVDYTVLAAVYQLYDRGYTDLDPTTLYDYANLSITQSELSELSISDMLKLGVYMKVENMDMTDYIAHLNTLVPSNAYALTSYLQALNMVGITNDVLAADLIEEDFLDPDFVGMSYSALYGYNDLAGFDTYKIDANAYLLSMLSELGISSWGSANSASTATVIMGLVAQGINPQDDQFTYGLVESLMIYESNGNFSWMITDEMPDLVFSTPQAFAALVAYKLARDVYEFPATSLFEFNN